MFSHKFMDLSNITLFRKNVIMDRKLQRIILSAIIFGNKTSVLNTCISSRISSMTKYKLNNLLLFSFTLQYNSILKALDALSICKLE